MSSRGPSSLQPAPNATREQVGALDEQVQAAARELAALKVDLAQLQVRYLEQIGPLYDELNPLDAAVAEAEIAAGLRLPPDEDMAEDEPSLAGCGPASAPSGDLKRMFRDIARAVHPDAHPHAEQDDRTRYRRHSLMVEANRAYAERDEDRLRLILRTWSLDPAGDAHDLSQTEDQRLRRRAAALGARLIDLQAELADLRRSAIAGLKARIDEARAQGWDLFGEIVRQVEREIAMAKATLAKLRRRAGRRG